MQNQFQDIELQKAREAHAKKVAGIILSQIKSGNKSIWQSWGMDKLTATHYKKMPSLAFHVNGLIHQGIVIVSLDECKDLYQVRTMKGNSATNTVKDVFCDELQSVIDHLVERPQGMTDKEYIKRLKQTNNPLLNWMLERGEAGKGVKIINL